MLTSRAASVGSSDGSVGYGSPVKKRPKNLLCPVLQSRESTKADSASVNITNTRYKISV